MLFTSLKKKRRVSCWPVILPVYYWLEKVWQTGEKSFCEIDNERFKKISQRHTHTQTHFTILGVSFSLCCRSVQRVWTSCLFQMFSIFCGMSQGCCLKMIQPPTQRLHDTGLFLHLVEQQNAGHIVWRHWVINIWEGVVEDRKVKQTSNLPPPPPRISSHCALDVFNSYALK